MNDYIDFTLEFQIHVVCLAKQIYATTDYECSMNFDRAVSRNYRFLHVAIFPKGRSKVEDDYTNEEVGWISCYSNELGMQNEVIEKMQEWLKQKTEEKHGKVES